MSGRLDKERGHGFIASSPGFTLVELLVVIGIIALLIEEAAPNDGVAFMAQNDADDRPCFQHNGMGCYGFADGHVQNMLPGDLGFLTPKTAYSPSAGINGTAGQKKADSYFYLIADR